MVYGVERWGEEQVIGYSYRYANKSQLDIKKIVKNENKNKPSCRGLVSVNA